MSLLIYFKRCEAIEDIVIPHFANRISAEFDIVKLCRGIKNIGLMKGVGYSSLSEELKTFLSIKYNPTKIYDVSSCSSDILIKILKLDGIIYAPYFSTSFSDIYNWDKTVDVDVVMTDGSLEHCNTIYEVMDAKCQVRELDLKSYENTNKTLSKGLFFDSNVECKKSSFEASFVKKNYKIGDDSYKLIFRAECYSLLRKMFVLGNRASVANKLFIDIMTRYKLRSKRVCHININAFYEIHGDNIDMELLLGQNSLLNFINQDEGENENGRLAIIEGIDELILSKPKYYTQFLSTLQQDEKNTYLLFSRLMSNEKLGKVYLTTADLNLRLKKGDLYLTLKGGMRFWC